MIRKDRKGFTLLELLVVIIILGIIMSFAIPALTGFLDRAREGEGFDLCRKALTAQYLWYQENQSFTTSLLAAGAPTTATRYWSALGGVTVNAASPPGAIGATNVRLRAQSPENSSHDHGATGAGQEESHQVEGWIDTDGDVVIRVDRTTGSDSWVTIGG